MKKLTLTRRPSLIPVLNDLRVLFGCEVWAYRNQWVVWFDRSDEAKVIRFINTMAVAA